MPQPTAIQIFLGANKCFSIGRYYEPGIYFTRNMRKAIKWYQASAALGSPRAQLRLGLYFKDINDYPQAIIYYQQAAHQHYVEGYLGLALVYRLQNNNPEAFRALKEAAILGDESAEENLNIGCGALDRNLRAQAFYHLGEICEHRKEWLAALRDYQGASDSNHSDTHPEHSIRGMEKIGLFYIEGRAAGGTSSQAIIKDVPKGLNYYKQAAKLGSTTALNELIVMAKSQGIANYTLGDIYLEAITNNEKSQSLIQAKLPAAITYFHQANLQGYLEAKIKLAEIAIQYQNDEKTACRYYLEAAEQAHTGAINQLPQLLDKNPDGNFYIRFAKVQETHKKFQDAIGWYKKAYPSNAQVVQQELMRLARSNPLLASVIGGLFEAEYPNIAMDYFILAAKSSHTQALSAANILADKGSADLKHKLAMEYYSKTGDTSNKVHWLMRAVNEGHPIALATLKTTQFDIRMHTYIAEQFEQSGLVTKNDLLAYYFYEKSASLGDAHGIYKLGEYNEQGTVLSGNIQTACQYYLKAAKANNEAAAIALERLAASKQIDALYALGNYKFDHLKNDQGLIFYAAAAQQKHQTAKNYLKQSTFSLEQNMLLAGCFEDGNINPAVASSIPGAIFYFQKASSQGNALASYRLGEYALEKTYTLDDPIDYFAQALEQGHLSALSRLESFGKEKNAKACYVVSLHYTHFSKKGIAWLICAADANHQMASKILSQLKIDSDGAFITAQLLETGKTSIFDVKPQLKLAFKYYQQVASNSSHYTEALNRLVSFYEEGLEEAPINEAMAAQFYLHLARKTEDTLADAALEKAAKLLENLHDWELHSQLGGEYEKKSEYSKAVHLYKKAADNNQPQALSQLNRMAQLKPEIAYTIGQLFEQNDLDRALDFYRPALENDYEPAVERVKKLALREASAMYAIACYHYQPNGQTQAAIDSLMRAAVYQHPNAIAHLKSMLLTDAQCHAIAVIYEKGEGIHPRNFSYAIAFRIKALDKKNPDELMHLAALSEEDIQTPQTSRLLAWKCYMKAAQLGSPDAIFALERIAEIEGDDKKQALSTFKQTVQTVQTAPAQTINWNYSLSHRASPNTNVSDTRNSSSYSGSASFRS